MWDMKKSPLYKYRDRLFAKDSSSSELRKWAFVGSYYKEYGMYIIKQYPSYYFRYFIWPNANKYYAPPTEFLGLYNSGKDSVSPIAKVWFGYKNKKIAPRTKDLKISALDFYPILSGVINVVMLVSLICFILLRGWRYNTLFEKAVFLGGAVWLLNAGFTIFASSAALRFQAFPILITFTFSLLLIDWLWKLERMKIKAGSEIKGSSLSMANS
jgi:hypothetical protein